MAESLSRPKTSVVSLKKMKGNHEKISMLTAYDASFARILDEQGVDIILVGDSLGMVIQGHDTTIPVTVDDLIYHTRAVTAATQKALVMADLPFMSYTSPQQALENCARLMQEGHAQMVKLEGGAPQVETVKQLAHHGVPVCAHLGLQPQSVHKLGGYRVQGRDEAIAQQMLNDSLALQHAGADMLLLECVPATLAARLTEQVRIPVIGIGAGIDCDGQVLVMHDVLGITPGAPRFSKDFMADSASIPAAIRNYVSSVKAKTFPSLEHSFS